MQDGECKHIAQDSSSSFIVCKGILFRYRPPYIMRRSSYRNKNTDCSAELGFLMSSPSCIYRLQSRLGVGMRWCEWPESQFPLHRPIALTKAFSREFYPFSVPLFLLLHLCLFFLLLFFSSVSFSFRFKFSSYFSFFRFYSSCFPLPPFLFLFISQIIYLCTFLFLPL